MELEVQSNLRFRCFPHGDAARCVHNNELQFQRTSFASASARPKGRQADITKRVMLQAERWIKYDLMRGLGRTENGYRI